MRFLPWIILGALLLMPRRVGNGAGPRSLRNNNPGNIKLTNIPWRGKVPNENNTDGTFEQFQVYEQRPGMIWGTRAMIKELIDSIINDGNNNLVKLINDWAAGDSAESRQNYMQYVSNLTMISPAEFLTASKGTLRKLVFAMADWEAGQPAAPAVTFNQFEESYSVV